MQLDKTHVRIRARTLSEIGDLALVMMRRYPIALLFGFSLGALPWMIANGLLLYWIPLSERHYGLFDDAAGKEITRYCVWMTILVFLQTPAAGVFMTKYIGEAVFEQELSWRHVIREVKKQFWPLLYVLGVRRLAIPVMVFLAFRIDQTVDNFLDLVLPVIVVVCAVLFRASRPFLPEILILEQCPLRDPNPNVITASKRAKSLHTPMNSELSGRFVAVSFIAGWLFVSILYSLISARGILTGNWDWGLFSLLVLFPLALWIVASTSVLMRYLNYLDTRIRLEGWEVELAIRAETIRQFGEDAIGPNHAATPTKKRGKRKLAKGKTAQQKPNPPESATGVRK